MTALTKVFDPEGFLNNRHPMDVFHDWHAEVSSLNLKNPDAMSLSTCGPDLQPRNRVVLLKGLRPEGLVFFTNYESRKGQDLAFNPKCSLSFYWDSLFRQVHFYGSVEKTTRKESEDYWRSRPRLSQLSQWISRQSEVAQSKVEIEKALKDAEAQFQNREIPCPAHWGGYLFKPTFVEFWIGREARLHDRYTYQLVEDQWRGARLYP